MESRSMNLVVLVGNLGKDPEARTIPSGTVCNLSVATTSRIKSGDEWKDKTEWHRVTCWGKTAEFASEYLKKGDTVIVKGSLRTTKTQEGKYFTDVNAESVTSIGGRKSPEAQSDPSNDLPF